MYLNDPPKLPVNKNFLSHISKTILFHHLLLHQSSFSGDMSKKNISFAYSPYLLQKLNGGLQQNKSILEWYTWMTARQVFFKNDFKCEQFSFICCLKYDKIIIIFTAKQNGVN